MSVRIMAAIWETALEPTDKLVILALADCANDEGLCWPSIATVARKSGVSERSVQRAIRKAEGAGILTRTEVKGKGCKYVLHPRHTVTPDTQSPPTECHHTPDTVSPKPSRTTKPKKDKPSLGKRPTRLPANFAPIMSGKTAAVVAGWPPGRLEDEVEHFCDHHTAKGTLSHDWQASWRTWVRNSKRWEPRNANRKPDHEWGSTVAAADAVIAEMDRAEGLGRSP